MPCELFSRDIGAKNARKIVFIASTRKSVFGAAALAIRGSIAKWHIKYLMRCQAQLASSRLSSSPIAEKYLRRSRAVAPSDKRGVFPSRTRNRKTWRRGSDFLRNTFGKSRLPEAL